MEDRFFVLSRECCEAYSDEEGPSDCRLLLSRFNTPHMSSFEIDVLGHNLVLSQLTRPKQLTKYIQSSSQDPNSKHLGTTVWDSSLVFAKFMERNSKKGEFSRAKLSGKRVIELGAGCGLAGLGPEILISSGLSENATKSAHVGVALAISMVKKQCHVKAGLYRLHLQYSALMQKLDLVHLDFLDGVCPGFPHRPLGIMTAMALLGCNVVVTDQVAVLPILLRNVERNLARAKYTASDNSYIGSIGNVEVAELDWGNEAHIAALEPPFDYIIGTDVVYVEHLLEPLMTTILSLAGPKTTVILGYEFRSSGVREQLHELCKKHFHGKKVLHAKMDPKYQHPNIDLFILRRIDTSKNSTSVSSSAAHRHQNEVGRLHTGEHRDASDDSAESPSLSSKQDRDTAGVTCQAQNDGITQAGIEEESSSDEKEFCGIGGPNIRKNRPTSSGFNSVGNLRHETLKSQPSDWEIRRLGSSVARLLSEVSPPSA